ncbi:MAG: hypothetical protein ACI9K2_006770 [Myxococcota bacterium]|jgi:hypothetical protein
MPRLGRTGRKALEDLFFDSGLARTEEGAEAFLTDDLGFTARQAAEVAWPRDRAGRPGEMV